MHGAAYIETLGQLLKHGGITVVCAQHLLRLIHRGKNPLTGTDNANVRWVWTELQARLSCFGNLLEALCHQHVNLATSNVSSCRVQHTDSARLAVEIHQCCAGQVQVSASDRTSEQASSTYKRAEPKGLLHA